MTDLAQQIRDRLAGLGPERGFAIELPADRTSEELERLRQAFIAAQSVPWTIQVVDGPKVHPGFEMMRDTLLAVLGLHEAIDGGAHVCADRIEGEEHFRATEHITVHEVTCPTVLAIAEKLGIEAPGE